MILSTVPAQRTLLEASVHVIRMPAVVLINSKEYAILSLIPANLLEDKIFYVCVTSVLMESSAILTLMNVFIQSQLVVFRVSREKMSVKVLT